MEGKFVPPVPHLVELTPHLRERMRRVAGKFIDLVSDEHLTPVEVLIVLSIVQDAYSEMLGGSYQGTIQLGPKEKG